MDAKVTVEEMATAIRFAASMEAGKMVRLPDGYARRLVAARDHILSAESQLAAANTRASELFNELGIVQNEAATQRGELERQIAEIRKVIDAINNDDWQAIVNACGECGNAAQVQQDPEMHCERHDFLFAHLAESGLTEANDAVNS